jgi:addiction module HigA family antidote
VSLEEYACRPAIASKRSPEIGQVSTTYGLTISTASVSDFRRAKPITSRASTTTRKRNQEELLLLVTRGEMLREEFMEPLGLSMNALAKALDVPANRIMAILKNQRTITADAALHLARYFGTSAEFWMNLQQQYELDLARREKLTDIEQRVVRRAPAREEPAPNAGPGRLRSGA